MHSATAGFVRRRDQLTVLIRDRIPDRPSVRIHVPRMIAGRRLVDLRPGATVIFGPEDRVRTDPNDRLTVTATRRRVTVHRLADQAGTVQRLSDQAATGLRIADQVVTGPHLTDREVLVHRATDPRLTDPLSTGREATVRRGTGRHTTGPGATGHKVTGLHSIAVRHQEPLRVVTSARAERLPVDLPEEAATVSVPAARPVLQTAMTAVLHFAVTGREGTGRDQAPTGPGHRTGHFESVLNFI